MEIDMKDNLLKEDLMEREFIIILMVQFTKEFLKREKVLSCLKLEEKYKIKIKSQLNYKND
jgi:hypothetical protein